MKLKGKVAVVTGASGSLGGAIATRLAEEGAAIAATYIGEKESAEDLVKSLDRPGVAAASFQLDQRYPLSIDRCIEAVIDRFSRIDILVNNAAWNVGVPFQDLDALHPDLWDRVLETNLRGPFLLARAAATHLKASGGHIVNISSAGGVGPGSSSIAYSCSNAGLNHLTRCLAVAMAPDVMVNCIAPGLVEDTRMANRLSTEVVKNARRQAVLGDVAQLGDIAEQTLAFCLSDSITGQTMVIDADIPGAMR